jgi:hypothetical protein
VRGAERKFLIARQYMYCSLNLLKLLKDWSVPGITIKLPSKFRMGASEIPLTINFARYENSPVTEQSHIEKHANNSICCYMKPKTLTTTLKDL